MRASWSIVCLLALNIPPAYSQPYEVLLVRGNIGAAWVDRGPEPSLIASVLYRFNPVFSLGGELVRHPTNPPPVEPFVTTDIAGREFTTVYTDPGGRSVTWAAVMRLDVPREMWRLVPFAVFGGGVDRTSQNYTANTTQTAGPPTPTPLPPVGTPVGQDVVGLQLMGGGGVSVVTTSRLSIEVDVRYLHYHELPDKGVGRIGVGVSYRY